MSLVCPSLHTRAGAWTLLKIAMEGLGAVTLAQHPYLQQKPADLALAIPTTVQILPHILREILSIRDQNQPHHLAHSDQILLQDTISPDSHIRTVIP